MRNTFFILLILFSSSCSTMKKTLVYSSLIGGITGSIAGAALSPNKESIGANVALFGAIGAGASALTGHALYKDDPRNYKLKNMLMDKPNENQLDLDLGAVKIDANLSKKEAYEVPLKELPRKLQGKVNKQYLIKYQSKERYIKQGSKTYYIPAFDIFEHAYSESFNSNEKSL